MLCVCTSVITTCRMEPGDDFTLHLHRVPIPIRRAAVSINGSSRLPPRENTREREGEGGWGERVGVPHQCSRADYRLLRGAFDRTYPVIPIILTLPAFGCDDVISTVHISKSRQRSASRRTERTLTPPPFLGEMEQPVSILEQILGRNAWLGFTPASRSLARAGSVSVMIVSYLWNAQECVGMLACWHQLG